MIKKLFLTLGILSVVCSSLSARDFDKAFRVQLAKDTATYYSNMGVKRSYKHYLPFVDAAVVTAKCFPMYPIEDELDRVISIYTMPSNESYYRYNYVNVNVPGMRYSSGRVKEFSLDYTSIGLNEGNITWTYEVAMSIQNQDKIENKYASKKLMKILSQAYIPETLNLRKIDLESSKQAKQWYHYYRHKGYSSKKIYYAITKQIKFTENKPEEIQSAFIYRAIVEIDRSSRGWNNTVKDEKLYSWLKQRTN